MTGHAYATSARTAGRMGPHEGYAENAEPMLNVLRMHRDASYQIDDDARARRRARGRPARLGGGRRPRRSPRRAQRPGVGARARPARSVS